MVRREASSDRRDRTRARARMAAFAVVLAGLSGVVGTAGAVRVHVFDAQPLADYTVLRNGTPVTTTTASPQASVVVSLAASPGDRVTLRNAGTTPVAPDAPVGLAAEGGTSGCARLSWDAPDPAQYVNSVRFFLYADTASAPVDSIDVDIARIVTSGARWYATWCGLPSGTWWFRARLHNGFDLWSAPSAAAAATVTGNDPQPPLPPVGLALDEPTPGCLRARWSAPGDPTVTGYRVYLGRVAGAWTDSLEAGTATEATRCGLGAGRWYAAARSLAAGGRTSAPTSVVAIDLVGEDRTPPTVSIVRPADGAVDVELDAVVEFHVRDSGAGVDSSTIRVDVAGSPALVRGAREPGGWLVQAIPSVLLPASSPVTVTVSASDLATPPNAVTRSWTFTTGTATMADTEPPAVTRVRPEPGTKAQPGDTLVVRVRDAGAGVDVSTVVLRVDGARVAPTVTGDGHDLRVAFLPDAGWTAGATVSVELDACDLAGNCAAPFVSRFDVESARMASLGAGAIVPDGYWAGQPTRPLEIRSLPPGWTVTIFDVTGVTVRRHRNAGSASEDWTWDFANDAGRRVVRGVYLVRVLDALGSVRRSGRFVVQSDG